MARAGAKKAKDKAKRGRPSLRDIPIRREDVVVTAVELGISLESAAVLAQLGSRNTLQQWQRDDPALKARLDEARRSDRHPNALARSAVIRRIQDPDERGHDLNAAKFWLERRDPDFMPQSRVTAEHSGSVGIRHEIDLSRLSQKGRDALRIVLEELKEDGG